MEIIKFKDFFKVNEGVETPEEYVKTALMKIKSKLEKMFGDSNPDKVDKIGDRNDREKQGQSLQGLELQSCEMSSYSKLQDSVKIKYSDAEYLYDLTIFINLEEAIPEDDTQEFSDDDIKKCHIKFKKYDLENFDLIGETTKEMDIKDINEDFLVSLKIDIDKEFDEDEEELQIETEEE